MILRRLTEAARYFDFPPAGYQEQPVKWVVVLNREGDFLGLVSTTGEDASKNNRGKKMLAPYVLRTSGIAAQLLADRADYALGITGQEADTKAVSKSQARHQVFIDLLEDCVRSTGSDLVRAVSRFLNGPRPAAIEGIQPSDIVTFEVDGTLLIDLPEVREYWAARQHSQEQESARATCLVCGNEAAVANPHPIQIKRVPGGQSSGCAVVSVNKQAFDSYGHDQNLSQSPVCWRCARDYAQVLNAFLADPNRHYRLHDRLAWVFWTREPTEFNVNTLLFSPGPEEVRALLDSVFRGDPVSTPLENAFYALLISGSGGRVVIRDWLETTVPNVEQNLARYLGAIEVVDADGAERLPIGLYALLAAILPTKARDPWKDLPPKMAADLVRCALTGRRAPSGILGRAISRARVEGQVTRPRAALIKLCLMYPEAGKEVNKLTPALNEDLQEPGYLCGRLLAILENIQRAAVPGINTTIVEKYYGSAASAPASVFGPLLRQAQFHLGKLRKSNEGAYVRLQSALEDVAQRLPQFPATLTLRDQGLFALGYYQQRAHDKAERQAAVAAKRERDMSQSVE